MLEDKKILFVLKCVVVALLLVLAVLTMTFNWSICHDGIQDIVSGRFSSEHRFNVIYSGGAFDQGGLTKLVILIFATELLVVLCYALAVSISRSRWWRVVCIAMTLVFFIAPVGMNLLYSWELARYIAVMGITSKRIEGALLSVLFMFVPMACLAGSLISIKSTKRVVCAAIGCVFVAGAVFITVNAAARKSISCHPLPTIIYP